MVSVDTPPLKNPIGSQRHLADTFKTPCGELRDTAGGALGLNDGGGLILVEKSVRVYIT